MNSIYPTFKFIQFNIELKLTYSCEKKEKWPEIAGFFICNSSIIGASVSPESFHIISL